MNFSINFELHKKALIEFLKGMGICFLWLDGMAVVLALFIIPAMLLGNPMWILPEMLIGYAIFIYAMIYSNERDKEKLEEKKRKEVVKSTAELEERGHIYYEVQK